MAAAADQKDETIKPVANGDAAAPMDTEEPAAPEQSDAEKVAAQLTSNVALIEKSVKQKETRMGSGRLLRTTAAIRRKLSRAILQEFISQNLPEDSAMRPVLLAVLEQVNL
jgi:26S proteasome regulatory subunit N3